MAKKDFFCDFWFDFLFFVVSVFVVIAYTFFNKERVLQKFNLILADGR